MRTSAVAQKSRAVAAKKLMNFCGFLISGSRVSIHDQRYRSWAKPAVMTVTLLQPQMLQFASGAAPVTGANRSAKGKKSGCNAFRATPQVKGRSITWTYGLITAAIGMPMAPTMVPTPMVPIAVMPTPLNILLELVVGSRGADTGSVDRRSC
jgi:hypothetical protein